MKQSAMLKFTILVLVVVALFLGGCVEVNNPEVSPTDFRSTVRFVNFANITGATTMSVTIDRSTATTATATFQNASAYMNLPAGVRFWSFSYGATTDTLRQALTPNTQYTFYSECEPGDATRSYVLISERRTFTGTVAFPSSTQLVRFIDLSSDTAATVSGGLTFHLMYGSTDTTTVLNFGGFSDYYAAPASASNSFMVMGAATDTLGNLIDTLVAPTSLGAAAGRYSVVFSGSKAASTRQAKVFQEN